MFVCVSIFHANRAVACNWKFDKNAVPIRLLKSCGFHCSFSFQLCHWNQVYVMCLKIQYVRCVVFSVYSPYQTHHRPTYSRTHMKFGVRCCAAKPEGANSHRLHTRSETCPACITHASTIRLVSSSHLHSQHLGYVRIVTKQHGIIKHKRGRVFRSFWRCFTRIIVVVYAIMILMLHEAWYDVPRSSRWRLG